MARFEKTTTTVETAGGGAAQPAELAAVRESPVHVVFVPVAAPCPCHSIVWHEAKHGSWRGFVRGEHSYSVHHDGNGAYEACEVVQGDELDEVIGNAVQLRAACAICESHDFQRQQAMAATRAVNIKGPTATVTARTPPVVASEAPPDPSAPSPLSPSAPSSNGVCASGGCGST